jgi:transposase
VWPGRYFPKAISTCAEDEAFAPLFAERGQPAEAPWRLALVTILQYIEGLSDRQAAEAVRSRIDWKYALNLELTDAGFDFTILCEFRARLLGGSAEQLLLDAFLQQCRARKLLKTLSDKWARCRCCESSCTLL